MAAPPIVAAVGAERIPVPVVTEKDIISPFATALPLTSVTNARMVLELEESAVRLLGVAVSKMELTAPGIKETLVVSLTPPAVAAILAVPTFVGLVRVAEATPLVVVAVVMVGVASSASRVPAVVVNVTVILSSTLVPLLFFTVAVIEVLDVPSATILLLSACILIKPTSEIVPYGESDKLHDSFSAQGNQKV